MKFLEKMIENYGKNKYNKILVLLGAGTNVLTNAEPYRTNLSKNIFSVYKNNLLSFQIFLAQK